MRTGGVTAVAGHGVVLGIIEDFAEPFDVSVTLWPADGFVLDTDGPLDSTRQRPTDTELVRLVAARQTAGAAVARDDAARSSGRRRRCPRRHGGDRVPGAPER